MLTGKAVSYGGSLARKEATGFGLIFYMREMLKATVEVESTVGVGTKVLVKIPKNEETRLEEC